MKPSNRSGRLSDLESSVGIPTPILPMKSMGIDAQREPNSEEMRDGGWWHQILDEAFFYMLKRSACRFRDGILEEQKCAGRLVRRVEIGMKRNT